MFAAVSVVVAMVMAVMMACWMGMAVAVVARRGAPDGRHQQRCADRQQECATEGAEPGIDAFGGDRRDREQRSQADDADGMGRGDRQPDSGGLLRCPPSRNEICGHDRLAVPW